MLTVWNSDIIPAIVFFKCKNGGMILNLDVNPQLKNWQNTTN